MSTLFSFHAVSIEYSSIHRQAVNCIAATPKYIARYYRWIRALFHLHCIETVSFVSCLIERRTPADDARNL